MHQPCPLVIALVEALLQFSLLLQNELKNTTEAQNLNIVVVMPIIEEREIK